MILVITHKTDITADFLINIFNQSGISYKRFNCEDILTSDLTFRFGEEFEYSILEETSYQSVWFRRTKLPEINGLSIEKTLYIQNEIDRFLSNIFSIIQANWISRPSSVYEAENKLLQLRVAQQIGFRIPETLITTSSHQLKAFYEEHARDIIIKPISQTRIQSNENASFIFTSIVSQKFIDQIEEFDLTPCIFQRNVPKHHEIRVTVIRSTVFAAAVYSQDDVETKVDWRKKKLSFVAVDLPDKIQQLCVQLLLELDLNFGAIDLIRTPDGEYIFLEINPNGQWVWIENQTGQKISDALIDRLTHDDTK